MKLTLDALANGSVSTAKDAEALFHILNQIPELTPQKCGTYEPVRGEYNPSDLASVLRYWGKMFMWQRNKPNVAGGVFSAVAPLHDVHAPIYAYTRQIILQPQFVTMLELLCRDFRVDYGCVHVAVPQDFILGQKSNSVDLNSAKQEYTVGVSTHELRRWVPDLFWYNVFGRPYVDLFGRERLLSAPVYSAREIAPDTIALQLTERIEDPLAEYEELNRVRMLAKEHLNCNAFCRLDLPDNHVYNVPNFVFGASNAT